MSDISDRERDKYTRMWGVDDYRNLSPGLAYVELFVDISKCQPGETLIDLGCGEGVAGNELTNKYKLEVEYLDIVKDKDVLFSEVYREVIEKGNFWECALWDNSWILPEKRKYGYCCDVLEHIPPEYTMLCIKNILDGCEYAFLNICNIEDGFGPAIGEKLHLTVCEFLWWKERIEEFGEILECRDFIHTSIFYVKGKE